MTRLEKALHYEFQDKKLLKIALQHSSYANERHCESYERLEFLGDSILGMVVSEYLFSKTPPLPEGELTRTRSALVREENLVLVAERMGFIPEISLGKGEQNKRQHSIYADVVEAILAALYLDGGIEPVRAVIMEYILQHMEEGGLPSIDYKTALQELLQRKSPCVITYEQTGEEGPDHEKYFHMQVCLNGKPLGKGSGKTKKESQQQAAKMALESLKGKKSSS